MTHEHALIKQEITETLYRYCRAVDRMDRELYDSLFTSGAPVDFPEFSGTAEGFGDWVWDAHALMQGHSHQITNVLVEVDDDATSAVSEASVTVCLRTKPEERGQVYDVVDLGRYMDRWTRLDDRSWRISSRVNRSDIRQVTAAALSPPATAVRDRSDPSYDLLG